MQAIILAAGKGTRLKSYTAVIPKSMIEVNGVSVMQRMLTQLDELQLTKVIIVVGYESETLTSYVRSLGVATPIEIIENPIFDTTNNIYSLAIVKQQMCEDDTLLVESDLIFEEGILKGMKDDPRPTLALVDRFESWMDGTVVELDADERITSFIPGKVFPFERAHEYYKTVNAYKFSREFSQKHYVPFLDAYMTSRGRNEYYERALGMLTQFEDAGLYGRRLQGERWYEIDTLQDLDIAEVLFATDPLSAYEKLHEREGGYWRFPYLHDLTYAHNAYYPSSRLIDEMKASMGELLCGRPSGQRVTTLLAEKSFDIEPEHVVVAHGASELIELLRSYFAAQERSLGFTSSLVSRSAGITDAASAVQLHPDTADLCYSVEGLQEFVRTSGVRALMLANPDLRAGGFIDRQTMTAWVSWCAERDVIVVIDETQKCLVDESEPPLTDAYFSEHPNLVVVDDISESDGVAGLRLGVLASGDKTLVAAIAAALPDHAVNAVGEYYLQIAEKYASDYREGISALKRARVALIHALGEIEGLRVLPSQGARVTVEVMTDISAVELAARLLFTYDVFVDTTQEVIAGVVHSYLQIGICDGADRDLLVSALKKEL